MFNQEKLSHIVAAALLIIAVSTIAVAEYFGLPVHKTLTDRQVFCTQEAKLCPDGSSVGRTGPNCEFAECPTLNVGQEQIDTTNWKTYRNEEYGFEVKYPEEWEKEPGYQEPGEEISFVHIRWLSKDLVETYAQLFINSREMSSDFIDLWSRTLTPESGTLIQIGDVNALVQEEEDKDVKQTRYAFVKGRIFYGITTSVWKGEFLYPSNVNYQEIFNQILSTFKFIESQKTAKDFFSVFQDRFDNPKGSISFEGNLPLTSEIACSIAKQACGSSSCEQIASEDTMQGYFGEIDWSVDLKPVCGSTTAFLNETKKTVLCFCAYE